MNRQAFLTAIGFPDTVDSLYLMLGKNIEFNAIFDADLILSGSVEGVSWTVPSWTVIGDLALFYCTANWPMRIAKLRKETIDNPAWRFSDAPATGRDRKDMGWILRDGANLHERIGGSIFAAGYVVGDREIQPGRDASHFRGQIFAHIGDIRVFDPPVRYDVFSKFISIRSQAAVTHVERSAVAEICKLTEADGYIDPAEFGITYSGGVDGSSWRQVVGSPNFRVLNEQHLRECMIDRLLSLFGGEVFRECSCWADRKRLGSADYIVEMRATRIAVEAKLRMAYPSETLAQLQRYLQANRFKPRVGRHKGSTRLGKLHDRGLIIDVDGVYVADVTGFCDCAPGKPFLPRTEISSHGESELHERLIRGLGL